MRQRASQPIDFPPGYIGFAAGKESMTHMYWYLAAPYTKYPGGLQAAYTLALDNAGLLIIHGIPVYSPIVHCHAIAQHCRIDPIDKDLWTGADAPLLRAAGGLLILRAYGWDQSAGIAHERMVFAEMQRPMHFMDIGVVPRLPRFR